MGLDRPQLIKAHYNLLLKVIGYCHELGLGLWSRIQSDGHINSNFYCHVISCVLAR